jgi:TRAP-type C4-dicarboxylate transport system permease small subunit
MSQKKPFLPGMKLINAVDWLIKTVIIGSMAAMLFAICLQVFFRFVLNHSLDWPEELARFTMIWSSMLAAVYVQLDRGHLSLDFFVGKLPRKAVLAMRILMNALLIFFMATVVASGIQEVYTLWDLKTGALRISRSIPYLAVPLSSALFIVATMILIFKDVMELKSK